MLVKQVMRCVCNPRIRREGGYQTQLKAGVTSVPPTPPVVIKVTASGSGGRANTSQDFRVMTPYLEIFLYPESPLLLHAYFYKAYYFPRLPMMPFSSREDKAEHLEVKSKTFCYQCGAHQLKMTDELVRNL